jgi:TPR repeat protein
VKNIMRLARNCARWSLCVVIVFGTMAIDVPGQAPSGSTAATIAALERQADALSLQLKYAAAFPLYLQAANLGSMKSECMVGTMYKYGRGVTTDLSQAFNWFLKASEQGSTDGIAGLRSMGYNNASFASAFAANQTLAAQGDPTAEYVVGLFYLSRSGTDAVADMVANTNQAVLWLQKATAQGSLPAEFELGLIDIAFNTRTGIILNVPQGLQLITQAANQGLVAAQNELGMLYAYGLYANTNFNPTGTKDGLPKDLVQSFDWYLKSAQQGDATGEYNVGFMYQTGTGASKDSAQAMAWYQKAATQANAPAEVAIAGMYMSALPATKNYRMGVNWQVDKAFWSQPNLHTPAANKNYALAMAWLQKAAAQGNPLAEYELGIMNFYGVGVPVNSNLALQWFAKAHQANSQDYNSAIAVQMAQLQMNPPAQQPAAQPTYTAQAAPAPQQTASPDSSQLAADYQHCAAVSQVSEDIGNAVGTFVQVGNSCSFPISVVAVSTAHRTVNGRSANDPGGGIGWNSSTMGDAFLYICPSPLLPADADGNLPTTPNQTIYCKQITLPANNAGVEY